MTGAAYFTGPRAAVLLAALFAISVFAQIDRILPFILAEAIKAELALSDTQVGLVTGLAFAVCYTLLLLPLARLADRGSPRAVLVGCTLVWSAMTALGGAATGFAFLALTRIGVAVGEAGAVPSAHALIARRIAPERRGLAIGIFSMGIPLGAMAGFALGGAVSDAWGWRTALVGAGMLGVLVALFALAAAGPTLPEPGAGRPPYLRESLRLLAAPAFRWLFAGAIATGFAAAPFYAFVAPFLIRVHGFSATEAGLAFGGLQGLMGIAGTLLGGRAYDRAARAGRHHLRGPAMLFGLAAVTTTAALLAPDSTMAVALLAPAMFAFTYVLPHAFGTAHLLAGPGREAMASSLILIGTGLVGPALGPLIVGLVSDAAAGAGLPRGLALGLMIVPLASALAALACRAADRRIAA
ncbi:MFS transporter [Croceibacterium sp. TMG7-5b_MA50]|uniref:MFS transporter n=1 Tax=Croceibacterium sp. TMG7-5b_MA50 TaxID=3121290 RepID=UPI0032219EC3